jgi:hypothetical protein
LDENPWLLCYHPLVLPLPCPHYCSWVSEYPETENYISQYYIYLTSEVTKAQCQYQEWKQIFKLTYTLRGYLNKNSFQRGIISVECNIFNLFLIFIKCSINITVIYWSY